MNESSITNNIDVPPFLHELWLLSPEWQYIPAQHSSTTHSHQRPPESRWCARLVKRGIAKALSCFLRGPFQHRSAALPPHQQTDSASPAVPPLHALSSSRHHWSISLSPNGSCLALLQHDRIVFRFGVDGFAGDYCSWPIPAHACPDLPFLSAWNCSGTLFAFTFRCSRDATTAPILHILSPSIQFPGTLDSMDFSLFHCGVHSVAAISFATTAATSPASVASSSSSSSHQNHRHPLVLLSQGGMLHTLVFDAEAQSLQSMSPRPISIRDQHSASIDCLSCHSELPLLVIGGSCLAGRDNVVGNISVWHLSDTGLPQCLATSSMSVAAGTDRLLQRLIRMALLADEAGQQDNPNPISLVTFSPDGRAILTRSRGGALQLWTLVKNDDQPQNAPSDQHALNEADPLTRRPSPYRLEQHHPPSSSSTSSSSASSSNQQQKQHSSTVSSTSTNDINLAKVLDVRWWNAHAVIVVSENRSVALYDPFDGWRLLSYHVEQFGEATSLRNHLTLTNVAKDRCFLLECQESVAVVQRGASDDASNSNWDIIGINDPSALLGGMFDVTEHQWNPLGPQSADSPHLRRVPKFTYRIIAFCKTTAEELLQRRLKQRRYDEALVVAQHFALDSDEVFMFRWTDQLQVFMLSTPQNIPMALDQIRHHPQWVLDQCLSCSPSTCKAAQIFLEYGIVRCQRELERGDSPLAQATLEQYAALFQRNLARFFTYLKILTKTSSDFDPVTLHKFSVQSIDSSAKGFASQAEFTAVQVLLEEHPQDLIPHLLDILDEIPCSAPPLAYRELLPSVLLLSAAADGRSADDCAALATAWYLQRARRIERESGIAQFALDLLETGLVKGFAQLLPLRNRCEQLCILIYDCQVEMLSLDDFEQFSAFQILSLHFTTLECDDMVDAAILKDVWQARKIHECCSSELLVELLSKKIKSDSLRVLDHCHALVKAGLLEYQCVVPILHAIQDKQAAANVSVWVHALELIEAIKTMQEDRDFSSYDFERLSNFCQAAQLFIKHHAPPYTAWLITESIPLETIRQVLKQVSRSGARQLIALNQKEPSVWLQLANDVESIRKALFANEISAEHCVSLVFESFLSMGKFGVASRLLKADEIFDQLALTISQDFLNSASSLDDGNLTHAQQCLAILGNRRPSNPCLTAIEHERHLQKAFSVLRDRFKVIGVVPQKLRALTGNQRFAYIMDRPELRCLEGNHIPDLLEVVELLGGDRQYGKLQIALALLRRHLAVVASDGTDTPFFREAFSICHELVTARYFPVAEPCILMLRHCPQLLSEEDKAAFNAFSLAAHQPDPQHREDFELLLATWKQHVAAHRQAPNLCCPTDHPQAASFLHDFPCARSLSLQSFWPNPSLANVADLAGVVERLYLVDLPLTLSILCTFPDEEQVHAILQQPELTFPTLTHARRLLLSAFVMATRRSKNLEPFLSAPNPPALLSMMSADDVASSYVAQWQQIGAASLDDVPSAITEPMAEALVMLPDDIRTASEPLSVLLKTALKQPDRLASYAATSSAFFTELKQYVATAPVKETKQIISILTTHQMVCHAAIILAHSPLNKLPFSLLSSITHCLMQFQQSKLNSLI